jgi:hypothetical protein
MRSRRRKHLEIVPVGFTTGEMGDPLRGKWRPPCSLSGHLIHCLVSEYASTITLKLEDFLASKAVCAGCGAAGQTVIKAGACQCNAVSLYPSRFDFGDASFVGEIESCEFMVLRRENSQSLRMRRRQDFFGVIPKKFTYDLKAVQENRCYYCAEHLTANRPTDPTHPNLDHMYPAEGSCLDNLVVSCRQCNTRKGREDADYFAA